MKHLFTIFILFILPQLIYRQKELPIIPIKKNDTGTAFTIDVYNAYQKKNSILLSQIADDIEYIPLETTNECLLDGTLRNIVITEKEIFIFDYNKGYRFTRNGKFINSIGKKGQGPGEYIRPMDMAVDTVNQWVYFMDRIGIVTYDYSGKHIKTLSIDKRSHLLLVGKDQLIIEDSNYLFAAPEDRYSIYIYSEKENRLLSKFSCERKDNIPALSMCSPIMYSYDNNFFLKDYWSDTIYIMKDTYNVNTHAVIKKGKFIYRNTDDQSLITGKRSAEDEIILEVARIQETLRFILLLTSKGIVVYDKNDNKTYIAEIIDKTASGIVNDLYGCASISGYNFQNGEIQGNTIIS